MWGIFDDDGMIEEFETKAEADEALNTRYTDEAEEDLVWVEFVGDRQEQ